MASRVPLEHVKIFLHAEVGRMLISAFSSSHGRPQSSPLPKMGFGGPGILKNSVDLWNVTWEAAADREKHMHWHPSTLHTRKCLMCVKGTQIPSKVSAMLPSTLFFKLVYFQSRIGYVGYILCLIFCLSKAEQSLIIVVVMMVACLSVDTQYLCLLQHHITNRHIEGVFLIDTMAVQNAKERRDNIPCVCVRVRV